MKLKKYCAALFLVALLATTSPCLADTTANAGDVTAADAPVATVADPTDTTTTSAGDVTATPVASPTDNTANAGDVTAGDANTATTGNQNVVLTLGSNQALLGDTPYQLEIPPEVINGTTFLPIRFVAEQALDTTVDWNPDTKEISLAKNGTQITLTLDKGQALVNGQEVDLANPPFVKGGRTLVPLRFLTENLAMEIDYNDADKTITIIKE